MKAESESTWEETDRGLFRKVTSMKTTNQMLREIIEGSNLIEDAITSVSVNPRSVKVFFQPDGKPSSTSELEDYQKAAYDIAKARGRKINAEIDNEEGCLIITSE